MPSAPSKRLHRCPVAAFQKMIPRMKVAVDQPWRREEAVTIEDVVGVLVFLASPAARYITGQTIYVDGGYTAG